jgi:hypothetical protein
MTTFSVLLVFRTCFEVKHGKFDLEQFLKEKVAFEEKIGEDASEEDTQSFLEYIGMIIRHKREIKNLKIG